MPRPRLRVVLTGGIGSGKSSAARVMAERGASVIDADRLGHQVLAPGGEAFQAVSERWPEVLRDGQIDRRALGRIVFHDRQLLAELEGITHPAIRRRLLSAVAGADGPVVVELSVPKLLEGYGWPTVVVDAPDEVRRERLLGRGMEPGEVGQRMAAQPGRDEWLELADHVIDNSGGLGQLEREVERVWRRLTDG